MKNIIFIIAFLIFFIACGDEGESSEKANEQTKVEAPDLDLHTAIYMRDLDAIRQHIKADSDLNIKEPSRKSTPLITAAAFDEPDAAQILIDGGANINATNMDGSTALITAAAFGKTKVAKVLINSGADLNIQNNDGSTALHTAAFLCNKEIVEALLNAGADKTIKNKRGNTAYESVSAPFENKKNIYDSINKGFKSLGTELDYDHIKTTRPIIAEMLK
jgi:ankyrin repeat protein